VGTHVPVPQRASIRRPTPAAAGGSCCDCPPPRAGARNLAQQRTYQHTVTIRHPPPPLSAAPRSIGPELVTAAMRVIRASNAPVGFEIVDNIKDKASGRQQLCSRVPAAAVAVGGVGVILVFDKIKGGGGEGAMAACLRGSAADAATGVPQPTLSHRLCLASHPAPCPSLSVCAQLTPEAIASAKKTGVTLKVGASARDAGARCDCGARTASSERICRGCCRAHLFPSILSPSWARAGRVRHGRGPGHAAQHQRRPAQVAGPVRQRGTLVQHAGHPVAVSAPQQQGATRGTGEPQGRRENCVRAHLRWATYLSPAHLPPPSPLPPTAQPRGRGHCHHPREPGGRVQRHGARGACAGVCSSSGSSRVCRSVPAILRRAAAPRVCRAAGSARRLSIARASTPRPHAHDRAATASLPSLHLNPLFVFARAGRARRDRVAQGHDARRHPAHRAVRL
jgi:hypothetical protein